MSLKLLLALKNALKELGKDTVNMDNRIKYANEYYSQFAYGSSLSNVRSVQLGSTSGTNSNNTTSIVFYNPSRIFRRIINAYRK